MKPLLIWDDPIRDCKDSLLQTIWPVVRSKSQVPVREASRSFEE